MTFTETVQEALSASVPADRLTDPAVATAVPRQVLLSPLGDATDRPAGRVSVNATPVSGTPELGFVMLKVRLVDPFSAMLGTPNALVMVGGEATVSVAEAVLPSPPLVEVTLPVVLFFTPAVVAVMLTERVHVPAAAMVPPEKVRVVSPAFGTKVPPQLLLAPGVEATAKPEGSESVKPTPRSWFAALGLVMVNVSVVVPPGEMFAAPKALLIDGGDRTVTVADAVPPVPPSVEVTAPVVLFFTPGVVAVMLTETVHVPLAATPPAEKFRVVSPALGAKVPHGALAFGVAATCRPDGKASVKLIPVSGVPAFGLVKVNANVAVPLSGIVVIGTVAVPPPDDASPEFVSV
jgi:hypothetical protein